MNLAVNVSTLSTNKLIESVRQIANEERKITLVLILHLREIEKRQAFLGMGYPSLHAFTVGFLGLSEASAQRRIQAMRLMRDVPEIRAKLETGEITLSNAAMIQNGIRKAEKERALHKETKKEIVNQCLNTSQSECERKLFTLIPETRIAVLEKERQINEEEVQVTLVFKHEVMEKIRELKFLQSHQNLNTHELIESLITEKLESLKKKKGLTQAKNEIKKKSLQVLSINQRNTNVTEKNPTPQRSENGMQTKPNQKPAHEMSFAQIKRDIYERAQGKCEIQGCHSRFKLEFDHIRPRSMGGTDEPNNLRLVCRAHNLEQAKRKLGANLMRKYVKSLN